MTINFLQYCWQTGYVLGYIQGLLGKRNIENCSEQEKTIIAKFAIASGVKFSFISKRLGFSEEELNDMINEYQLNIVSIVDTKITNKTLNDLAERVFQDKYKLFASE